jgi:hypothetical protein
MRIKYIAIIIAFICSASVFAVSNDTVDIYDLVWADSSGKTLTGAHIEDTVYVNANVSQISDGTEISITIFENNKDSENDYVTQFSATVNNGIIHAAWQVSYDEDQENTQCFREIAEQGYTIPEYIFSIRYNDYQSPFSTTLIVWDWIQKQLHDEDTGELLPNFRYELFVGDGTKREGITNDEGYMKYEDHLPLGPLYILLVKDDANLVRNNDNLVKDAVIYPKYYTVGKRIGITDMLYRIAALPGIYNDPTRWQIIYEANKEKLRDPNNPHLILKGMILEIPSIKGERREGNYDLKARYTPIK